LSICETIFHFTAFFTIHIFNKDAVNDRKKIQEIRKNQNCFLTKFLLRFPCSTANIGFADAIGVSALFFADDFVTKVYPTDQTIIFSIHHNRDK